MRRRRWSMRRYLAAAGAATLVVYAAQLTKTMLFGGAPGVPALLGELRRLGVTISIDDFGTGHSSLAYLHTLPVDELKIDRSFVSRLPNDATASALITAMVSLGHTLDLRVVAEGVEEQRQVEIVRALGCDAAQGHLFARPQPAHLVTPLLAARHGPAVA